MKAKRRIARCAICIRENSIFRHPSAHRGRESIWPPVKVPGPITALQTTSLKRRRRGPSSLPIAKHKPSKISWRDPFSSGSPRWSCGDPGVLIRRLDLERGTARSILQAHGLARELPARRVEITVATVGVGLVEGETLPGG